MKLSADMTKPVALARSVCNGTITLSPLLCAVAEAADGDGGLSFCAAAGGNGDPVWSRLQVGEGKIKITPEDLA